MPLPLGYTTFVNIKYATFYFIFLIMKLLGNPKIKKNSNIVQMKQIKI